MNKKLIFITIAVLFLIPFALAQNNPGHDSLYILRGGDTISGIYNFTGQLLLPTPTQGSQAATKSYVDAQVEESGDGSVTEVDTGAGLTGGPITTSGTINVDQSWFDNLYLQLSGGTMDGSIDMDGNTVTGLPTPISGSDAATKDFVESQVGESGDMSSFTIAGDSGSSTVGDSDIVTISGGNSVTTSESGRTVTINVDDDFVPYTGASQDLDMNQQNIQNFEVIEGHNSDYGIYNNGTETIIGYIGDLT